MIHLMGATTQEALTIESSNQSLSRIQAITVRHFRNSKKNRQDLFHVNRRFQHTCAFHENPLGVK